MDIPVQPTLRDTVVGRFDRNRLSAALAAVHRAGFGQHARVFDGERGDLTGQLRRANLALPVDLGDDPDTVLLVVTAPGRGAVVTEMLLAAGASDVYPAAGTAATVPVASEPRPVVVPPAAVDLAEPNDG